MFQLGTHRAPHLEHVERRGDGVERRLPGRYPDAAPPGRPSPTRRNIRGVTTALIPRGDLVSPLGIENAPPPTHCSALTPRATDLLCPPALIRCHHSRLVRFISVYTGREVRTFPPPSSSRLLASSVSSSSSSSASPSFSASSTPPQRRRSVTRFIAYYHSLPRSTWSSSSLLNQ